MFCIKICCLEPEPVGAGFVLPGAGAEEKWFGSATLIIRITIKMI